MPTNTKQILRDQDGYPIPQEWDAANDVYVPLPPIATETTLAAVLAKLLAGVPLDAPTLAALETIQIGNFPATQPISAAALPLPSGAATQTTLAAVLAQLAAGVPLDATTLAALETIQIGNFPATQAVSAASLPLPAGASTEATLAAQSAKLPASVGLKADAASLSVGLSTEQRAILAALATEATQAALNTLVGAVTETAPATDTASSGVSGRLQRIAQRLTSLIGLLPSALVGGRFDVNVGAAVLPTGAATETTLAAQSAKLPASVGLKADAASLSVGLSTEQRAILVAQATEATLAALSAKLPASVGLKADAASLSVGFSTEQRAILAALATDAKLEAVRALLAAGIPLDATTLAALESISVPALNAADDGLRAYTPAPDGFVDASGNVLLTKYVDINGAASATTAIVAAVTGARIQVVGYSLDYGGAAGAITLQDGAGTPSVLMRFVAETARKVTAVTPMRVLGRTGVGVALNIVCPATVTAVGWLAYLDGTLAP